MGGTIFISYRREEDTEFAGRLFDRLERTFRRKALFMVDSIAPGQDFVSKLETRVAECDVLLALIGRGWLTATDEAGRRRLDNTEDFVRIEIATALTQRKCVIPVLIDDVPMPQAEDLPEVLTPLVRCQATRLSHERFNADSNRLIRTLEKALAEAGCGKRDWKALYTLFSDLWGRYSASSPKNRLIGQQILDHARNPSIPLERVAEEAQSFRLPIDLYGDWDKLEKLRDAFHDLQHFGFTQGEPAASVYQSAIQIKGRMLGLQNESIDEDGEPGWFYRGQRCAQWPTVPSINRELGDVRGTESEYLSRVSRIRRVVSAL